MKILLFSLCHNLNIAHFSARIAYPWFVYHKVQTFCVPVCVLLFLPNQQPTVHFHIILPIHAVAAFRRNCTVHTCSNIHLHALYYVRRLNEYFQFTGFNQYMMQHVLLFFASRNQIKSYRLADWVFFAAVSAMFGLLNLPGSRGSVGTVAVVVFRLALKVNSSTGVLYPETLTPPSTFGHAMKEWQEFCQGKVCVMVRKWKPAGRWDDLLARAGRPNSSGELPPFVKLLCSGSRWVIALFTATNQSCLAFTLGGNSFLIS